MGHRVKATIRIGGGGGVVCCSSNRGRSDGSESISTRFWFSQQDVKQNGRCKDDYKNRPVSKRQENVPRWPGKGTESVKASDTTPLQAKETNPGKPNRFGM